MQATLYHAHHSSYTEDLPFWAGLAAQQGGRCLELGCGTGRVLLPLARAGQQVYGLDRDVAMLAFLQARLRQEELNAPLFQADLTDFHLSTSFRLILLPCNTYSTLDAGQRAKALACIYAHLENGGLFAVSLPNPALLASLPAASDPEVEDIIAHPESGQPVQISSAWQRQDDAITMTWHYDTLLPDGNNQRDSAEVTHYICSLEQYQAEMAAARFSLIHNYGDFDRGPYSPESAYPLLIAERR